MVCLFLGRPFDFLQHLHRDVPQPPPLHPTDLLPAMPFVPTERPCVTLWRRSSPAVQSEVILNACGGSFHFKCCVEKLHMYYFPTPL